VDNQVLLSFTLQAHTEMNRLHRIILTGLLISCLIPSISSGQDNQKRLDEALLAASLQGDIVVVEASLAKGADVNAVGRFRSRPLHLASSSNRDLPEIVKLLIKAGADLNPKNSRGQTPLHLAVSYNRLATIKILLDNGADSTISDNDGKIPEDYTFNEGYKSIYMVLSKYKKIQFKNIECPQVIIQEVPCNCPFTNSVNMKFVYVKPGTFLMGSPASDLQRQENEFQHRVTISKGFYMQTTEVTQGQWEKVMGGNSPRFRNKGDNYPVAHVTWYECQKFIEQLNRMEKGKTYRLPTEAEWEFACRAGTQSSNPWDVANDNLCDYANVADMTADKKMFGPNVHQCKDSFVYTAPVETFKANAFGLFDMIGNVWEWCQDYAGPYPSEPVVDPTGPKTGKKRVIRGCGWSGKYRECRSAYRGEGRPGETGWGLGFRVVIENMGQ
jgi:formylglycine-generating enzyme required for sulfatase activity/predicted component of type VI protein secretion system